LSWSLPTGVVRSLLRGVIIPEGSPLIWSEQPSPRQPWLPPNSPAHALLN